jgi:hypothetical protein
VEPQHIEGYFGLRWTVSTNFYVLEKTAVLCYNERCILNGTACSVFDTLTALENWVEKGIAPDKIIS